MASPRQYRRRRNRHNTDSFHDRESPVGMTIVSPGSSSSTRSPSLSHSTASNLSKAAALRRKRLLYEPIHASSPVVTPPTNTPSPVRGIITHFVTDTTQTNTLISANVVTDDNLIKSSRHDSNFGPECTEKQPSANPNHMQGSISNVATTQEDLVELNVPNQHNEADLRQLQDRFHQIEEGLGSIGKERSILVGKSKQLDTEKRELKRELILREKEISALAKRCASQESKMKESATLRRKNRELKSELEGVQKKLMEQDQEQADLSSLRKKLQESELNREQLQDRIFKIQREHDAILDTLTDCLAQIKKLTDEKKEYEAERLRDRRRAEAELDRQRKENFHHSNALKEDLVSQQDRINQMERILQENMATNTSLRREKAIMVNQQKQEIQNVINHYEAALSKLQKASESQAALKSFIVSPSKLEERYKGELNRLRDEMNTKDSFIQELEEQFSQQMSDLMTKSSELESIEEERKQLENQISRFRSLEYEHSALVDFVNLVEENLAEVTSENAHLKVEKDALDDHKSELEKKVQRLEGQIKQLQGNRKAREADYRALVEAEHAEVQHALERDLAHAKEQVTSLDIEVASKNTAVASLEEELKYLRKSVIDYEYRMRIILQETDRKRVNLDSVSSDRKEAVFVEMTDELKRLESINKELSEKERLRHRIESERDEALQKVAMLEKEIAYCTEEYATLEQAFDFTSETLEERDNCIQNMQEQNVEQSNQIAELESALEDASKEVSLSEEQIISLENECLSLKQDVVLLQESLDEKENHIQALQRDDSINKCGRITPENLTPSFSEQDLHSARDAPLFSSSQSHTTTIENDDDADTALTPTLADACLNEQGSSWDDKSSSHERELEVNQELLSQSLSHSTESVGRKENALDETKRRNKCLEEQIESKDASCVLLMQELEAMRTSLIERESRIKDIEDKFSVEERLRDKLERDLDKANAKVTALEKQLVASRSADIASESTLESQLQAARESLSEKESRIQAIEEESVQNAQLHSTLEKKLEDCKKKVTTLQKQIVLGELNYTSREKYIQTIEEQFKSKEDELHSFFEKKLYDQNAKVGSLEKQVHASLLVSASLEQDLKLTCKQLDEQRHQAQSFKQEVQVLKDELQASRKSIAEHEIHVKVMKDEKEKNECSRFELQLTLDAANAQVVSLEQQLASCRLDSMKFEGELDALKIALHERNARGQLDDQEETTRVELETKLLDASSTIASLEEEVEEWKGKHTSLHEQNSSLEEELEKTRLSLSEQESLVKPLQAESDKLRANFECEQAEANKRIKSAEQERSEMETKLLSASSAIATLQVDVESWKGKHTSLLEQNSSLEEELEKTRLSLSEQESLVKPLQAESDKLRVNFECEQAEANKRIKSAEQERSEMETKLLSASSTISTLEEEVESWKENHISLQEKHSSLEKKLNVQSINQDCLTHELKATKDEMFEKNILVEKLIDQQLEHHREMSELQTSLHGATLKVSSLENKLETSEERNMSLQQELQVADRTSDIKLIEESYAKSEGRRIQLEANLADAHEEIMLLEEELNSREERIASLMHQIDSSLTEGKSRVSEIMAARKETELLRLEFEKSITEARDRIKSFETELSTREERQEQLEDEILKISGEKDIIAKSAEDARMEQNEEMDLMRGTIESQKKQLLKLDQDLTDARRVASVNENLNTNLEEAKERVNSLKNELKSRESRVISLDHELSSVREILLQKDDQIESIRSEIDEMKETSAEMSQQSEQLISSLRLEVSSKNDALEREATEVSSLKEELCHAQDLLESKTVANEQENQILKRQIQKLTTEVALKDDEIRDLRLFELEESEEVIASLRSEASNLKQQITEKELTIASLVGDFEKQVEKWRSEVDILKQASHESERKHGEHVATLAQRIKDMETDNARFEAQLREHGMKLHERDATIERLKETNSTLEQSEQSLRTERNLLLKSEDKLKAGATELTSALKLQPDETKLAEVQKVLDQRTSLLSEVVALNKELESKMEEQQVRISGLEEDATRRQAETSRMRQELEDKEKKFTDMIQDERLALAKLKSKENENSILKDKLEAYQKNLNGDKVLRDRNLGNFKSKLSSCGSTPTAKRSQIPRRATVGTARRFEGTGISTPRNSLITARSKKQPANDMTSQSVRLNK